MSPETAGQRDGKYSVAEATRLKEHARDSCPRERRRVSFTVPSFLLLVLRPLRLTQVSF